MQPTSQETAMCWLKAIESHAKEGSYESRNAVLILAENSPDFGFIEEEGLRATADKIIELARSRDWEPTLSPLSARLLRQICRNYIQSKAPKPTCARKLFF